MISGGSFNGHPNREHATAPQGLHVCPECGSPFVHPLTFEAHSGEAWELELHCPECGWTDSGVFGKVTVEEFADELDRATSQIESDLAHLIEANMADYVDRFSTALAADGIQPIDF